MKSLIVTRPVIKLRLSAGIEIMRIVLTQVFMTWKLFAGMILKWVSNHPNIVRCLTSK